MRRRTYLAPTLALATVVALGALGGCGKKDDPLADRFSDLCASFVPGGKTLGDAEGVYFPLPVDAGTPPCGNLTPLPGESAGNTCGPISSTEPVCEYSWLYHSIDRGECYVCRARTRPPGDTNSVICAAYLFHFNC